MTHIDDIMELLDCNQSEENQVKGRELAKDVKCIDVFLRPRSGKFNKNVWDNCAAVLSERTDEELSSCLDGLLVWLQDLNWPGALCILDRLQRYSDPILYTIYYRDCLKCAQALEDDVWASNLRRLKKSAHNKIDWLQVLHRSVSEGRVRTVQGLLDEQYCGVNEKNSSDMTALMFAAGDSTPEMVRLLLDYGADKACEDKYGNNAYDYAAKKNKQDIMALLED